MYYLNTTRFRELAMFSLATMAPTPSSETITFSIIRTPTIPTRQGAFMLTSFKMDRMGCRLDVVTTFMRITFAGIQSRRTAILESGRTVAQDRLMAILICLFAEI